MTKRLRVSLSLLLLASACGGAHKTTHSNTPMSSEADAAGFSDQSYPEDPRAHIAQLSQEIGDMRTHGGQQREPESDDVRRHDDAPAPQSESVESTSPSVRPMPVRSVCESTCTIKANICRNAAKICKLATELENSESADWADEKCDSGKVSCKEAKAQCDECDG